jgi:hypothetical protein
MASSKYCGIWWSVPTPKSYCQTCEVEEFHEADQQNNKKESRQLDKGVLQWIAPPHGVFKIN